MDAAQDLADKLIDGRSMGELIRILKKNGFELSGKPSSIDIDNKIRKLCDRIGHEAIMDGRGDEFAEDPGSFLDEANSSYEEDNSPECPMCGGPLNLLGSLGKTKHYRCRDCGMTVGGKDLSSGNKGQQKEAADDRTSRSVKLLKVTYDNWFDKFKPVKNHINENAAYDGYMFETYGKELEYVSAMAKKKPGKVWTLVNADNGHVYVTEGYHHVDRIGYFITEVAANPNDQYSIRAD